MARPCSFVILAAGQGTRMHSPAPKPLFDVCGVPSLEHVIRAARGAGATRVAVVVGAANRAAIERVVSALGVEVILQDPLSGTGHAVKIALEALKPSDSAATAGDLVVLYSDGPLIRHESLRALLERHRGSSAAETVLTAIVPSPTGYGRIARDDRGELERIVEEGDADAKTREIREINTGICAFAFDAAERALARVSNENSKREYYLTDTVAILRAEGARVTTARLEDSREARSFNSHAELAEVRRILRDRIVQAHQAAGVDVVDPATAFIDSDVTIGAGTTIHPCTVIAAGVKIGRGCSIGPFAHLRTGTVLADGAEVGNFVEAKNTQLGESAKAKHLTYLGDTAVGARANVGAGTITANYDGKAKHKTAIGAGAFIGSGTVLIAPVEVGEKAITGAGAVVLRNTRIGAGEVFVGVPARPLDRGAAGRTRDEGRHP